MDWFQRLTGFVETSYDETRSKLVVEGEYLKSLVNGRSYRIGTFDLASLAELRSQVRPPIDSSKRIVARVVLADVRDLLVDRANEGALFQVASQFNMLEMVGPQVTPEDGVTNYIHDHTQGPACAVAAGAATIFRNYFAPVGDQAGQTKARQLDGLSDLGAALRQRLDVSQPDLWSMRNGYALPTEEGLGRIEQHLAEIDSASRDALRSMLRIGVQSNVEVTEAEGRAHLVSQAFCSALPIAYSRIPRAHWRLFASLILEGAYEATLLAGVSNAQRGGSNVIYLTLLGGGAFGNSFEWIAAAIRRALECCAAYDLDVRLVSYDLPDQATMDIVDGYRPNQPRAE